MNFYARYLGVGGGSGGGVTSLNGQTGALTLVAGSGITIVPGSGTLTINSSGVGSAIISINGDTTSAQTLTVGTSGSDFNIVDAGGGSHVFNLPTASASNRGALSSADWTTFNSKQPAGSYITALTGDGTASGPGSAAFTLATVNGNVGSFTNASITVNAKGLITAASSGTTGNLTDAGTDGITITGGTGAVLGTGTSISQHVADTTHNGYLSSTDWNTFNSKGSGSVTSVSVVSANGLAGTVATATTTPAITLSTTITGILQGNGTAISAASTTGSGAVVLATSPSLTTPALDTPSSITLTNATGLPLTTGVTGVLPVANGGTGQSSLTAHDVLVGNGTSGITQITPSTAGFVLTSNGTSADPSFQSPASVSPGSITLPNNQILVGQASGFAAAEPMSGDVSIVASGATTIQSIQGTAVSGTTGTGNVVFSASPTLTGTLSAAAATFSSAVNLGSNQINNLAPGTSGTDAINLNQLNAGLAGLQPQTSVYAATTANIPGTYLNGSAGVGATFTTTATGTFTVDGTTPPLGARILIKDQSSGFQNGIYSITTLGTVGVSTVFTRTTDYDTASDMNSAGLIPVINGTTNALTSWQQIATITTVGTDSLVFQEFTANPSLYLLSANNLSDVANANTSFNNISPMTTAGDIIYENATPTTARLPIGTTGQVLTVVSGLPAWAAPATSGTVTSVSVVSANGLAGTVATATTTPAITLSTTITGILQGNGTAISAATTTGSGNVVLSASPTLTGTIVAGAANFSGAISASNFSGSSSGTNSGDVTLTAFGSTPNADGLSLSGQALTLQPFDSTHPGAVTSSGGGTTNFLRADGTWAAPPGATAGTVTSVSVVSANGLAGTVATATTTPAITLSTTITGILQGNGTAISAAGTTGSGNVVLATSPSLSTPALGTPSAAVLTNATGLPLSTGVTGVLPVANATIATQAQGTVTTSTTINWANGNVFTMTLTSGDTCVVTFSNPTSGQIIVVEATNGASGGTGAITWPTVKWAGGTPPTMTTGTAALDVYTFVYNGSFYVGSVVANMS